jgi:hypothetical protein
MLEFAITIFVLCGAFLVVDILMDIIRDYRQ